MARDYGEGSIDSRGKDRWRLRYRVGGKRYSKTVRGSITDAKKELRRLLKSSDDSAHVAPDKITLAQWIDSWLELRRRKVNARTLERYAELMKHHVTPTLGEKRLQAVAPPQIDVLYERLFEKGLSARTVHHVHTVLGAVFRTAEQKNLISRNPVTRAEAPTACNEDAGQALDQDQLTALVNGFRQSSLFPIVATAAYTGARRGEIFSRSVGETWTRMQRHSALNGRLRKRRPTACASKTRRLSAGGGRLRLMMACCLAAYRTGEIPAPHYRCPRWRNR